jgi:uncharacterized protein with PIN domain
MKGKGKAIPGKGCPECGGPIVEEIRPFSMERVFFGNYPFWVCTQCGEVLTPMDTYRLLEKVARAKGLFGTEKKATAQSTFASLKRIVPSHA